ncbi:MAG: histidinol dehydrogenase [Synergistaceae bacterium]|nr:histidinol dehydrogenase [Synergistaceae bacterium]
MEYLKKPCGIPETETAKLRETVAGIIKDVRENGDEAVSRCNLKFDGCVRSSARVSPSEIAGAYAQISEGELADIREAAANIRRFAEAQRDTIKELPSFSPFPGLILGHRNIPVDSCCCYVPGGNYPLYSTALMLAIPAKMAGVGRVTACSPVMKGTENIHPKTLAAMDAAGVDEIYAVGGAQAIAAFSYGTAEISPVDLIVGPGNIYVTEAKRQCFGQVGIDFVAGPSEVLIIADGTADPKFIAADLLAQSEHDRAAKGILVAIDPQIGSAVVEEVERQLRGLDTEEIARASWEANGEVILAGGIHEAISIANERAPEHLELQTSDDESIVPALRNYGSLFIGKYAAEVFGDYASGTNHTLPTVRAARYTGGIWVGTFMKTCTHQSMTADAIKSLAPLVSRMAHGEGLTAHARAAEIRMNSLQD